MEAGLQPRGTAIVLSLHIRPSRNQLRDDTRANAAVPLFCGEVQRGRTSLGRSVKQGAVMDHYNL